jgi:hypothetical protein
VNIPASGEYLFLTDLRQYARLLVDGQLMFVRQPSDAYPSQGRIYLNAGPHTIMLEYSEAEKLPDPPIQCIPVSPMQQVVSRPSGRLVDLARNKPATASSQYNAVYAPSAANNGILVNAASGWAPTDNDQENWWQVDLGNPYRISKIELIARQYSDQPWTRRNFEVRAANDPKMRNYVVLGEQGNNPFSYSGTSGTWEAEVTDPTPYRYIRATKTLKDMACYAFYIGQLRVWGYE